MEKNIVVLGLGNPLMSDEGIGGFLISKLLEKKKQFPDAEFIDAGTGGLSILHLIAGRKKAVIIDCALMDTQPGTIKKFSPDDVVSVKKLTHLSLHEADLISILRLAEQLGQCPKNVVIFGIEPETVKLGMQISSCLEGKIQFYVTMISREMSL